MSDIALFPIRNIMVIMFNVKDIISVMPSSPSQEGVELIKKAYAFAENAHKEDDRLSGEPYMTHLQSTACTLAELGLGPRTISAGLLHDVIEDARADEDTIKKEFGEEVLFLIQGVTKLGHLKYRGVERHVGSLQKLFVATSQDVRVLLIKLADRLHNMKTLDALPKAKQKRIALETLEIYVPLAYRLGVRRINRELEDLSFVYIYPKEYTEVKELLKQRAAETNKRLDKLRKSIRKAFAKEKLEIIETYCRIKGLFSLYKKLQRKDKDIEKVYDVAALRIVVSTVSDCYSALGIIHGVYRPLPGRIKDYIAFPKPNGYQSLHTTIFAGDGSIAEIQIRTAEMHRQAEFGIASHFAYKTGDTKGIFNQNLDWLRQLLPNVMTPTDVNVDGFLKTTSKQEDVKSPRWIKELAREQQGASLEPQEFIKILKADFFDYRIFVFTPKGDAVDLPTGSSPVDFAYAIHSDIGNHISGAKVNGKLTALDAELENGDIVEIITKDSSHPTRKWVDFAKTTLARRHIRTVLQKKKT